MFKYLLALGLCSSLSAFAQSKFFDEPLKPLNVTLTADFSLVNTPRQTGAEIGRTDLGAGMIDADYFASMGTLSYVDESGKTVSVQVKVEPRGMRRRRDCEYKPLDVKPLSPPHDQLLEGVLGSLEMSTHCRAKERLQALYNEYFNYRLKNSFNVPAFKVRLAQVTYVDTKGKFSTITMPALFLESKKNLGERFGGEAMHLTKEEKKIPPTEEEISVGSWAQFYGDSFVPRMTERYRIYKKYAAAVDKVPLTPAQVFRDKLSRALISNFDVMQNYLLNVFAFQYKSGAVTLVEYDFDEATLGGGWNDDGLMEVYGRLSKALGYQDLTEYNAKRGDAGKKADREEILRIIEESLRHYENSDLEKEILRFKRPEFDPSSVKKLAEDTVKALREILANPNKAFSFIK
jgi:hypothetical protein